MKKVKVMVFGVFDLLHPGHVDFLKQAKELGDYLIVSVARDVNVVKVKGRKPVHNEKQRVRNAGTVPFADKVVLGGLKDPWPHIIKQNPDVIALGYDQNDYIDGFKSELISHKLKTKIVRLKPHWPEVYKSKLLREKI